MTKKFVQVKDGEWFKPKPQKGHLMKCCDCGLVHKMDFVIKDNEVIIRARRIKKKKNSVGGL